MKLTDIIDLAKQGYKPNDIKELIELAKASEETEAETPDDADSTESDSDPEDVPTAKEEEKPKDETDYKKYKKLYEESQQKLAKAQKANAKREIDESGKPTDEDILADFCRSFM